jgi:hypothetical protein
MSGGEGTPHSLIQEWDRPVMVIGDDPTVASKSLRMMSAALPYTIPENGRTVYVIVHQAIHAPHLSHNIISMMHMRLNDVVVNETLAYKYDVLTEGVAQGGHEYPCVHNGSDVGYYDTKSYP